MFHLLLCERFPGTEFENWFTEIKKEAMDVNWEKELTVVQEKIEKNAIVVEVTLTAYKSAPKWLGDDALISAEGYGTVYEGITNRSFLWTIPFYPNNIISSPKPSEENTIDLLPIHLDFLGDKNVDQNLFDDIANRLVACTSPTFEEGTPTLQNPESVMEMLIYFENINKNGMSDETLEKIREEIKDYGLIHYWTHWILTLETEDEQVGCLEVFIQAVKNCWNIGQTYKFSFIPKN